jgi:hypothetical protein
MGTHATLHSPFYMFSLLCQHTEMLNMSVTGQLLGLCNICQHSEFSSSTFSGHVRCAMVKTGRNCHMGGCSPIHQWIFTYHDLLYNFWMTMPHPTHVIWQSPVFFWDWGQSKVNTPIHPGCWGVGLRWTGDGSNKKHSASHNVRIQPLPAKDPSVTASLVADISDAMLAS